MWPRAVIEATEPIVKRMRKADLKFNKSDERNQFEATVTRSIVLPKNIFSRIAAQVRDNFISFIPFGLTAWPLTRPGSLIARSVSNGVVGNRIFKG